MEKEKTTVEFFRKHLKTSGGVESFIKHLMQHGQQNVHTPFALCKEIIVKLQENTALDDKKIAVLFNVEFLHVLVNDFGVDVDHIFMFADDSVEMEFCRLQYKMKVGVNLFLIDIGKTVEEKELYTTEGKIDMKFDVIVGNPPYQSPRKDGGKGATGNTIWDKFVHLSLGLVENGGFMSLVHPARWRKPMDKLGEKMRKHSILHLEIYNKQQGLKTFGATTRYDWYVLQKSNLPKRTIIRDENGKIINIDTSEWPFIPNFYFEIVEKCFATDDKVSLLYSRSAYGADKSHVSGEKVGDFKYPCIAGTGRNGVKLCYSKTKNNGFFGVPKVIFGDADIIASAVVDFDGEYAMTQHAMAIPITSKEEGEQIKKALESDKFNEFLKACRWSNFMIDYTMFKHFRKDFWKEFV